MKREVDRGILFCSLGVGDAMLVGDREPWAVFIIEYGAIAIASAAWAFHNISLSR